MTSSTNLINNIELISAVIKNSEGNSEQFAETIRHERIPHLSFSKITSVEFCEYRYFLQYVLLKDPIPTPDYFTKGKLMHEIIAESYKKAMFNRRVNLNEYIKKINCHYSYGENHTHLMNALTVHIENLWQGYQVVAVEEPFVMGISSELPPCVGVIDLILNRGDEFIIVDHKTGRDFYPQDELQMGIYVECIKNKYGNGKFQFYYDLYRWVNNLDRIRKPAFQRTAVSIQNNYWWSALERIRNGYITIRRIENSKTVRKSGECFRCPYRNSCR